MSIAMWIIAVVAVGILVFIWLVVYGAAYNIPADELKVKKTGDDLISDEEAIVNGGKVILIDAPPSVVYPYLAQLNLEKAGFYSFSWLERLFGFHIYNTYTIEDRWQNIKKGDWIFYKQNGIGTGIVDFKENEYILSLSDSRKPPLKESGGIAWVPKGLKELAWTWNFLFEATPDGKTRFYSRSRAYWEKYTKLNFIVLILLLGITGNVMTVKMIKTIKKLAEKEYKKQQKK